MDKKLPKVFQNKIDKDLNNNNKFFYSATTKDDTETEEPIDVNKKINEIFSSPNYVYKANVEIKTKSNSYITKIIGRNKNYIITMDNKTIPISEIVDIKKNSQ